MKENVENQIPKKENEKFIPVTEEVLKDIEKELETWSKMAKKSQRLLFTLGTLSIGCSLFITAFAGSDFLKNDTLIIRILAFSTTLFLTIITSFNLSQKANNCRNAWRHLNKAIYSYKCKRIDGDALIKAYEEGENILGSIEFNFNAKR